MFENWNIVISPETVGRSRFRLIHRQSLIAIAGPHHDRGRHPVGSRGRDPNWVIFYAVHPHLRDEEDRQAIFDLFPNAEINEEGTYIFLSEADYATIVLSA